MLVWGLIAVGMYCCAPQAAPLVTQKMMKYGGCKQEMITFASQDQPQGQKMILRNGLLFRKTGARAVILVCHGFMCNKFDVRCLRSLFSQYHVFVFDFRAHGENVAGQCCSFGRDEALDVLGAAHFIKTDPELKDLPLIVYGFSMGAAAAILAQAQEPLFTAAILDCPFESTNHLIGRGIENIKFSFCGYDLPLPRILRSLIQSYAYHPYIQELFKYALKTISHLDPTPIATCIAPASPQEAAKSLVIPALYISCAADDKTPFTAVKQVYDASKGFKRFWITQGRWHFDSFFYNPEAYQYRVNKFIEQVLDQSYKNKKQEKISDDTGILYEKNINT